MIISARVTGAEGLADRLQRALAPRLSAAAVTRAADAITLAAAREGVVLEVEAEGAGLRIGTGDPQAILRETGTLDQPAEPWLQPLLSGLRRRP